jgi:hypothetical protein
VPDPGHFTTLKGWTDPFELLSREDPSARVASVLGQSAVPALYSGAALLGAEARVIVEGKVGEGDSLMLGIALPEHLPDAIVADVEAAYHRLAAQLGPVRFEWVHDGKDVWIVQLHIGATETSSTVIVEGDADRWLDFDPSAGLAVLRDFIANAPVDAGIVLTKRIGLTSHLADTLRRWGKPSRIQAKSLP